MVTLSIPVDAPASSCPLKVWCGKGVRPDGASVTKIFMGSTEIQGTVKPMALDHPGKPFPFAEASDIHNIPRFKEIERDFLTQLISLRHPQAGILSGNKRVPFLLS